jgi:hypothetical protein
MELQTATSDSVFSFCIIMESNIFRLLQGRQVLKENLAQFKNIYIRHFKGI